MENGKTSRRQAMAACVRQCCNVSLGAMIVKVLVSMILIFILFMFGVQVGVRAGSMHQALWYKNTMMQNTSVSSTTMMGGKFMPVRNVKELWRGDDERKETARLFGSITKIEGNKITVMTNAAKEQIVISEANTVITNTTGEIGLSALVVGKNITVFGALDGANQFQAELIKVL